MDEDDEFAVTCYRLFTAFVEAGFSEFQALRLVALMGGVGDAFAKGMPNEGTS